MNYDSYEVDKQKRIDYIAKECNVSKEIARIALDHARGSIPIAKDLLSNEHCKFTFGREVGEFGLK